MDSFFRSGTPTPGGSWSYESLKNFRQISPAVQNHLKLVYLTLCGTLAAAAVGAYLHILMNIGGMLTLIACSVCLAFVLSTPVYNQRMRFGLLMATALFQGASLGPLIDLVLDVDPSILVTGFVGTSLAFACFTGAAVVARRREFLYLGGLLSSGLSILFWLHLATSIFGHSAATFNVEIYFGLMLFLGYMVFDTQQIIEKAHLGDMDYVKHALMLFTDFVAVFVRILIILLRNQEKKDKKKKRT